MAGSALMEALMGAQYKASENPWGMAAGGIGAAVPLLTNPYQSTGKNIGYTVGASLLAGLLGGLAQRQRDQENLTLMSALQTGMSDPGARMEIAKENPRLSSVFNAMQLEEQQRQAESIQKMRDAQMSMEMDLTKAQRMGPIELGLAKQKEDALGIISAKNAARKLEAENNYWAAQSPQEPGVPPQYVNPNAPGYKIGKDKFEQSTTLRKNFEGIDEIQKYKISSIGFKSLVKAAQDPSSTSDLELVRGAIQAIEPGMAVREGEQAAVANSTSIPDAWRGALTKALTGQSALPMEVRDGVLRIAARRYEQYANMAGATRKTYEGIAQRGGLNTDDVLTIGEPEPAAQIWPGYAESLQQAQAQAKSAPAGMTFEQFKQWQRSQR